VERADQKVRSVREEVREMFVSVSKLKVGDPVLWRGCFGKSDPVKAVITEIEIDCNGSKYGTSVDSAPWSEIHGCNVIVSLDNGCWAYGFQITPYV
jgi:hypothetical protein